MEWFIIFRARRIVASRRLRKSMTRLAPCFGAYRYVKTTISYFYLLTFNYGGVYTVEFQIVLIFYHTMLRKSTEWE